MKHETDWEQRLVAYADGELEAAAAGQVEAHLEGCDTCRQTLDEYRRSLNRVLAGFADPAARQAPSTAAIELRLARIRRRRVARSLAVGAAVACLCLLLWSPALNRDEVPAQTQAALGSAEIAALKQRIADLERRLGEFQAAYSAMAASQPRPLGLAQIEREEVAAICVAAGRNLEQRHGDVEGALARYRYVVAHFPDASAAHKARERIEALSAPVT